MSLPFLKQLVYQIQSIYSGIRSIKVRKILERASTTSSWLEYDELVKLQKRYPFPPEYGYDPKTVEIRGKERAIELQSLLRAKIKIRNKINSFLEIGCWDGMTCYSLKKRGYLATGIDNRIAGFDKRAIRKGASLLQMDAEKMAFKNESFDFVFVYESFEHFADPKTVFEEILRVVKNGGYIYAVIGPLYMSPWGLHAYRSITVPYLQFLFPGQMLSDYTRLNDLKEIDFDHINGWSLENFQNLWKTYSHRLKTILNYEWTDVSHLDLILKYPSCFRSKTHSFNNLTVSVIDVLFQKNQ